MPDKQNLLDQADFTAAPAHMSASVARSQSYRGLYFPTSESLSCLKFAFPTNSTAFFIYPDYPCLNFRLRRIPAIGIFVSTITDGGVLVSSSCVKPLLEYFPSLPRVWESHGALPWPCFRFTIACCFSSSPSITTVAS